MTCKHSTYKDGLPVCKKGYPVQIKKCMGREDKKLNIMRKEREKKVSTIFDIMVAVIIPVVLSTIISILLSLYICCYAIKHYIAATAEDERKFMGEITKITDEAFARIGKR